MADEPLDVQHGVLWITDFGSLSNQTLAVRERDKTVRGVVLASRPNSPTNGAAAEIIGLGDETGHKGRVEEEGEVHNDENERELMQKSDMSTTIDDDCFVRARHHAA